MRKQLSDYLYDYLRERPFFLSLIRAKESYMYQDYLPFQGPILDIGCGDGYFAKIAFGKNIDVGLDIEDSRIDEAAEKKIYKQITTYDGQHFPFPDHTFETVLSNCVLEHVSDVENLVRETCRVLKPGGKFIPSVMASPWETYLVGAIIGRSWYQQWMRKKQVHVNVYAATQWRTIFQNAGFEIRKETGYLDKRTCRLIDVGHYLSLFSLISYQLTGKWVLYPLGAHLLPLRLLAQYIEKNPPAEQSGAIFYELQKPA